VRHIKDYKTYLILESKETYEVSDIRELIKDVEDNPDNWAVDGDGHHETIIVNSLKELLKIFTKKEILVYRYLAVDNKEDINSENLGKHFTYDKNVYGDVFKYDVGLTGTGTIYLVEVLLPVNKIDVDKTIRANLNYPHECEITASDDRNLHITKIEKVK